MATLDEVSELIDSAVNAMGIEIQSNFNEIRESIKRLQPLHVEPYAPVAILPDVSNNNTSLHLIKSLPEFKGKVTEYPAWREAAHFAINYYPEGSENYYIAMGILRNKISGSANVALSAFNTILNFKAIVERLDQCYSDKRPIHVLENELSILRQGELSIQEFYNNVDKQLTLIVNKIKMSNNNNEQIISILNDRARESALRVFISGLKRPLCDILFASNTKDLPSALATAQELEFSYKRQEFAKVFAHNSKLNSQQFSSFHGADKSIHPNVVNPNNNSHFSKKTVHANLVGTNNNSNFSQKTNNIRNPPTPMDVDPSSSFYRRNKNHSSNRAQGHVNNAEQIKSLKHTPFSQQKIQLLNHMPDKDDDYSDMDDHEYGHDVEDEENCSIAEEED